MTAERYNFPATPWLDTLLRQAVAEDVGTGDVTTELIVTPGCRAHGAFVARAGGVVAGLSLLPRVYALLDERVTIVPRRQDGERITAGDILAEITGPTGAILTGERIALNLLQYLSGIATRTARYVEAVAGTDCVVLDTRKTLPGYRDLAKYAVRCGGGRNHRLGLYDRYMLKDNHWVARRDSLPDLVAEARRCRPDLLVEVEVDDLEQLADVLPLGVDWILLDNFTPAQCAEAIAYRSSVGEVAARTRFEASGNITLQTVRAYAMVGVDAVSVGRLTHSVTAMDIGLDLTPTED